MDFDLSNYLTMFLEESHDNLDRMNDTLLSLEKEPDNAALVDELFRVAHTLKGMAATMGFKQMADLTHHMENLLDKFRKQELQADASLATLLFSCLDLLSDMVEGVEEHGEMQDHDTCQMVADLEAIASGQSLASEASEFSKLQGSEAAKSSDAKDQPFNRYERMVLDQAQEQGYGIYSVKAVLEEACLLKAARAYLLINNMEKNGEIIRIKPTIEEIEKENFDRSFEAIYVSQYGKDYLDKELQGFPEVESVDIFPLHDLSFEDPEEEAEAEAVEPASTEEASLDQTKAAGQQLQGAAAACKKPVKKAPSIRVDLDRLADIMNHVSELVIHRSRIEKIAETEGVKDLEDPLSKVSNIISELQDEILKIRMQPIELVFKRFPRMVRDLSQELGKELELIMEGEDTALDRTVVSELGEPLVHMVRNAVGHGIESPEERRKAGKDPVGIIRMMAAQEGNRAVITIQDDGAGLDPEKLKKVAEKKGLDTRGMDDHDLQNIIFAQGFSTTEEINSVSGRGVGMDVVKQKIASLGGHVDLTSVVGQGTTFKIRLPLSLSIIQALLVGIGQETYAISLGFVERVLRYRDVEMQSGHAGGYIVLDGQAVLVVDLAQTLAVENSKADALVIVKVGDERFALAVDRLYGQQDIVIKPFGQVLADVQYFVGATILGDGMLSLILDPVRICRGRGVSDV